MTTLIEAFDRIKSVPYKIVDVEYSLENSNKLISSKGASCTPKHVVLDDVIKSLGYETRFCVHEFNWSSFNIEFPKSLADLINPTQVDYHTNIEVKINDHWIRVDATWDDAIIDAGFPGTKKWDGEKSTLNCVHSINEFRFETLEERNTFIKSINNKIDNEFEFVVQLNTYLEDIRKKFANIIY